MAGFLVSDLEEAVAELEAAGVEIVLPIQHGGPRSWRHLRAPDGCVYELVGGPHTMIARVWRGESNPEQAQRYVEHLEHSVFPELREIEGHRDAYLLQRSTGERVSFLVLTLWDSMDAVRSFAGDDPEAAVVEPAARAVLSGFDETVEHYEIVLGRTAWRRKAGSHD